MKRPKLVVLVLVAVAFVLLAGSVIGAFANNTYMQGQAQATMTAQKTAEANTFAIRHAVATAQAQAQATATAVALIPTPTQPPPVYASSALSQLVFLDQTPGSQVYSIYISGPNQKGVPTSVCWPTPSYETVITNWWWMSTTHVTLYTDSNCQNYYGGSLYFNSDNAAYRCLQDVTPYSDWDCSP